MFVQLVHGDCSLSYGISSPFSISELGYDVRHVAVMSNVPSSMLFFGETSEYHRELLMRVRERVRTPQLHDRQEKLVPYSVASMKKFKAVNKLS